METLINDLLRRAREVGVDFADFGHKVAPHRWEEYEIAEAGAKVFRHAGILIFGSTSLLSNTSIVAVARQHFLEAFAGRLRELSKEFAR